MPLTTAKYGLPYPEPTDPPDVPADMKRLAEAIVAALDGAYAMLPVGTILPLAPGAVIPPGWALCDGHGGRPNLAGRTLVGSGTATDGTHLAAGQSVNYVVGQSGGAAAVKLTQFTSGIGTHTHSGTTSVTIPGHTHTVPGQTLTSSVVSTAHQHGGTTNNTNLSHQHGGSTSWQDRSGTHSHGIDGRQPALHFRRLGLETGTEISGTGVGYITDNGGAGSAASQQIWGHQDWHNHGADAANTDHLHGFATDHRLGDHAHAFATDWRLGDHSHTVTVAAATTSNSAPVGSATVSLGASNPVDARDHHENRMPYYVVQYIMRVA